MIARARRHLALFAAAALLLMGCGIAGSYQTVTTNGHEKVYKYDDAGNKNLVYEIEKDGTLTVHDETDSRAEQLLAAQARVEQAEEMEARRVDTIRQAPKRQPGDPIRVVLHEMQLSPDMAKAQHSSGAAMAQFRENFENDSIIQLVNPSGSSAREWTQAMRALSGKSTKEAPASDIEVVSSARVEKKAGLNRETGKIGEYAALVLEATITCNYIPAQIVVTEEGNIFRNAEVMKSFADQIKSAIKNQIGPTIPADRGL